MRYYHATPARNLEAIRLRGLLPNCGDARLFLFPERALADCWAEDNASDETPWVVLAVEHDGPIEPDPFMGAGACTAETVPAARLFLLDGAAERPLLSR